MNLLGRIFGPSLGTRLGAGDLDTELGDRGHRSELVEFRLVAAPLFIGAGALGLVATLITVTSADPMPGFRPLPVSLIAVGGLVVGSAIATTRYVTRAWMIHLCGAFACGASTFASYWSGPSFGPYGAIFLILTAIALVMFLDRRGSLVLLILIGISSAVLLAVHHPTPSPVSRWILLVGVCAVGAATVDALIGRLAETTRAEAVARRAAETARDEADTSRVLMEEASRHKSEFLANMSHELRTPLN
ncbi:MAG: hypothetical protein WBC44_20895, partial [Planctomycetaceae bacterium]